MRPFSNSTKLNKRYSMAGLSIFTTLLASFLLPACSSTERSRSLTTAGVPISTIAQQLCANCHGASGVAASPAFPNLAGQTKEYLAAQLNGFRSHRRSDKDGYDYMWGISANLSDEQIDGLAAYFAAQTPARGKPVATSLISQGKQLYLQGLPEAGVPACVSCHGEQAAGMQIFPRLAAQHSGYLEKQLRVFQKTDQRPDGSVMKEISHSLSDQQIVQLSAYLQSLNP